MSFCQTLWQANLPLYQRTLDLPFNRELAAGTLSRERFRHYMIQDAHYLVVYGRSLAVAAAKADNADGVVQFANAANEAVVEERKLHSGFMPALVGTRLSCAQSSHTKPHRGSTEGFRSVSYRAPQFFVLYR